MGFPRPLPTLEGLPTEIHLEIIGYLDIEDLIPLSQMNHYFYCICDTHGPRHHEELKEFLVFAERNFPNQRLKKKKLACIHCLRMLPHHAFGLCQTRIAAWHRFCLECELLVKPDGRVTRDGIALCSCGVCQCFHEELDRRAKEERGVPASELFGVVTSSASGITIADGEIYRAVSAQAHSSVYLKTVISFFRQYVYEQRMKQKSESAYETYLRTRGR